MYLNILSEAEARKVYALICLDGIGDEIEQKIVNKIIRALDLK